MQRLPRTEIVATVAGLGAGALTAWLGDHNGYPDSIVLMAVLVVSVVVATQVAIRMARRG